MFINKEKNPTQVGKVNSSDMQTKPSRSNNKWFSVNHIGLKKNQSDKNKIFIIWPFNLMMHLVFFFF